MSASTRIVCGMFFAALSLYVLEKWLSNKKWIFIPIWMICQLVSFCYYEQVLALTGFMTLLLMVFRLKKGEKSALIALLTFANFAIYFIFTGLNNHGDLSSRINTIFPWQEDYFTTFLPILLRQIGAAFIKGGTLTLYKGFYRGIIMVVEDRAWIYVLLFILAALSVFFISNRDESSKPGKYKILTTLAASLLLILVPLAPYFIILNPWFSLRAVVTSLVGIALMFDVIFTSLLKKRNVSILTAVFVIVAGIASVSELHDYKATYDYDTIVINKIIDKTIGTVGRTGILNLNGNYLTDQNYYYHEHIHGVIESDWALQGALYSNRSDIPEVVPLATDGFSYYVTWNRNVKRIGGFKTLYWWDPESRELIILSAEGTDEQGWSLYDSNRKLVAIIWEEPPYGYIKYYR